MKVMSKGFQVIPDIYEPTARCVEAGIMGVCRRLPGAEFWINIFTPYPWSPNFYRAQEIGVEVPKSLEGWMDYFP
jgi:anaerobic magnesium-protoporphyrin IX monomethyl ester cyclase